jgi:PAS domain S-box-containing protein
MREPSLHSSTRASFPIRSLAEQLKHDFRVAYWKWKDHLGFDQHFDDFFRLLGYEAPPDTESFFRLLHPEDQDQLKFTFGQAQHPEEPTRLEFRIRDVEGEYRWFAFTFLRTQSGPKHKNRQLEGFAMDIHYQKLLEENYLQAKQMLGRAGQFAGFGQWEFNPALQKLSLDAAATSLLNLGQQNQVDLSYFLGLFHEDTSAQLRSSLQKVLSSKGSINLELQLMHPHRRLRLHGESLTQNGQVLSIAGFLSTASETPENKTLGREEELIINAFLYAPIAKAILTPDKKWIQFNDALCQLLGYSEAELRHKSWKGLSPREDTDKERELEQQLLNSEIAMFSLEKKWLHRDGHAIDVSLSVSLIRDIHYRPLHFVVQVRNISPQKQLSAERQKTIDTLTAQNNQLTNFAHIVSHNLRSHSGNLEMLCQLHQLEQDPAEREMIINNIQQVSKGLSDTINHLSEVVKVTQDINKKREQLSFEDVFQKTCRVLEGQIRRSRTIIEGDFEACPHIAYPPAYLESIFLNLISNGIKYRSQQRRPKISLKTYRQHNKIAMDVRDNGIGIDLNKHGRKLFGLYKTFHHNDDARGVGLFLVKNQVEAMGGQIEVDSAVGEGTCFRIIF